MFLFGCHSHFAVHCTKSFHFTVEHLIDVAFGFSFYFKRSIYKYNSLRIEESNMNKNINLNVEGIYLDFSLTFFSTRKYWNQSNMSMRSEWWKWMMKDVNWSEIRFSFIYFFFSSWRINSYQCHKFNRIPKARTFTLILMFHFLCEQTVEPTEEVSEKKIKIKRKM